MPQILFVAEVPPIPDNSYGTTVSPAWSQFANKAAPTLKTAKGTKQLQSNAWLLPADNALPVLAELSALASTHNLSYSALLVPDGAVVLALDVKPKP